MQTYARDRGSNLLDLSPMDIIAKASSSRNGVHINIEYWQKNWAYMKCVRDSCLLVSRDGLVLSITRWPGGEVINAYDAREPERCECNCGGGY